MGFILLPVQKSQKAQDTMRFKVEMCHFSQAQSLMLLWNVTQDLRLLQTN